MENSIFFYFGPSPSDKSKEIGGPSSINNGDLVGPPQCFLRKIYIHITDQSKKYAYIVYN